MFKTRTLMATLAAAATLSACGGDDDPLGVNSGDPLTEAEIQEVFSAISEAFSSLSFGPAAVGPAAVTVNVNLNDSGECPAGGSIVANGSAVGNVDDVNGDMDIRYQLRMDMTNCAVETPSTTITMNSAPYIQLDMDFVLTQTLIDVSGSQTGGIAYTAADGRSGSCAFNVTFSSTANLQTQSGSSSASGTVCGVSASGLQVWSTDTTP